MIRQCASCGNCGEGYRPVSGGWECHACTDERALFDADELGLDPETDNTPNHQDRVA